MSSHCRAAPAAPPASRHIQRLETLLAAFPAAPLRAHPRLFPSGFVAPRKTKYSVLRGGPSHTSEGAEDHARGQAGFAHGC